MSNIRLTINEHAHRTLSSLQLWHNRNSLSETIALLVNQYHGTEAKDTQIDNEPNVPSDPPQTKTPTIIDNIHPNDLSHTKPISATLGEAKFGTISWKDLFFETFRRLKDRGVESEDIVNTLTITAASDDSLDDRYPYEPESGITISPQSAPTIWREICNLASTFGMNVEVKFRWTENPKATYPGQIGVVRYGARSKVENRKIKVRVSDQKDAKLAPYIIDSDNEHLISDSFLKKTKLNNVLIDKKVSHCTSWIDVLNAILVNLKSSHYFTTKELISEVEIIIVEGYYDDSHYNYVEGLNCSIKYSTGTQIGKELIRLCDKYDIPLEVHFYWKNDPDALYPNQNSVLLAGGASIPISDIKL